MKKRKLFINDPHHPIHTLWSLQKKVVLPETREAYDLGLKGLAMSSHCHMFLWKLKRNQIGEPQWVETTVSSPSNFPLVPSPLVSGSVRVAVRAFSFGSGSGEVDFRTQLVGSGGIRLRTVPSSLGIVTASHLVSERHPGSLRLCPASSPGLTAAKVQATSIDTDFRGLASQVCDSWRGSKV